MKAESKSLRNKKKVDYEALQSPLMRIPKMDIAATRSLIDLGIKEIYELKGRDPNILHEEASRINEEINDYSIRYFRLAVYYAENITHLNKNKIHPDDWA
jgi:hypothetical protein